MVVDPNITAAGVSLVTNFITRGDLGPVKTLGDIWDIVLGNYFHALNEKSRAKHQLSVDNFKKNLGENISNIQEENLQEPKMSIVGPALEASKYYFDEKEIREMFANLIASSMDSTYNGSVQHSFVEIIKQLSPYDAKLFASLEEEFFISTPSYEDILGRPCPKNFSIYYYQNEKFPNRNLNAISLENLKKQGLIDFQSIPKISEDNSRDTWQSLIDDNKYKTKIERYVYITKLGQAFKNVCLKDSL